MKNIDIVIWETGEFFIVYKFLLNSVSFTRNYGRASDRTTMKKKSLPLVGFKLAFFDLVVQTLL